VGRGHGRLARLEGWFWKENVVSSLEGGMGNRKIGEGSPARKLLQLSRL
jgi:hypothetical protein